MRARERGVLVAVLMTVSLLAGSAHGGDGRTLSPKERAAKEKELADLRARIGDLRQDLDRVRSRYDSLRGELRDTERRIGTLAAGLRRLDGQIAQRGEKLRALRGQKAELEGSVAGQRAHLVRQVRAAYAMGRQQYVKILLNQEEPDAVGRVLVYYDYLNRARSQRIAALQDTLRKLEAVRKAIAEEAEGLEKARRQQQQEKEALETGRKDRDRLLAALGSEIRTKDQRLERMIQDEQQLAALIRALSEALADIPAQPGNHRPFAQLRGRLPWPARGPLIARFGRERPLGRLRWQGILISAREGREVKAVSHGRVAFADWLRGYGLLLIIDHGDGYMSLYGHNQSLFKEVGDWVEAGDVVATVGNSGGMERTALYFEIRKRGKPTDPARWLARARR